MFILRSFDNYQLVVGLLGVLIVWPALVTTYRAYFHPLSHVPGPKLAAITRLYIFYYNVIEDGGFYLRLDELHKKYGRFVISEQSSR